MVCEQKTGGGGGGRREVVLVQECEREKEEKINKGRGKEGIPTNLYRNGRGNYLESQRIVGTNVNWQFFRCTTFLFSPTPLPVLCPFFSVFIK